MTLSSDNTVYIDRQALSHNFRLIQQSLGGSTSMMAMVKSDAYGHGMKTAARVFADAGCSLFGVAELGEAVALRESGCKGDILVFLGFDRRYMDYVVSHDLTPVVFSREDLATLSKAAVRGGKVVPFYLKFDCGMSRLGFKPEETGALLALVDTLENLTLRGMITHFPSSDDRGAENSLRVHERFTMVRDEAGEDRELIYSACNSGGTLYFAQAHENMVRCGIALYGYYPDGSTGRPENGLQGLRPVMSFTTRVLQINEIARGTGVSYGHTYTADRDTQLAVLPVGYSDGYLRNLSNRAEVIIRGRRAPIRGRICMNMCMADVTDIEGVSAGDEAVLLGTQGNETIDADEIGSWCDTISYEILCALGNNNERKNV